MFVVPSYKYSLTVERVMNARGIILPMVAQVAAEILQIPAAILFSGIAFTHCKSFADVLKLQCFGERHFYNIQKEILIPVVTLLGWNKKKQ